MFALLLGGVGEEGANARQLARGGCRGQALGTALGEVGTQVRGSKVEQRGRLDELAPIQAKEIDQPVRGRDISAHGMRGTAAIMLKIGGPASRQLAGRVTWF